jgi:hypothetical protein
MTFKRKDAINFLSFLEILHYSEVYYNSILNNILGENGEINISEAQKTTIVSNSIKDALQYVVNEYLEFSINKYLNLKVTVVGKEPNLHPCPCCEFKTLQKQGEYCVCEVCYWEDDGNKVNEVYSAVNHMTLAEAKVNFLSLGIVNEKYLKYAHKERIIKYKK